MSPKVRLGLIGAGVWGSNYIKTIEQIEGVILKKIVCKNPQNKKALSQKYEVTNNWLELSKSKELLKLLFFRILNKEIINFLKYFF